MRVAVLDWGIGGVPCLRLLRERCVELDLLYISDAGHRPYGLLTAEELTERVDGLIGRASVDLVVLACNAASSIAADLSTSRPVESLVAHGVALARATGLDHMGILGGQRVVQQRTYGAPLEACGLRVTEVSGQPLSALVERAALTGAEPERAVEEVAKRLHGVPAVLLACTHYEALSPLLSAALPGADLLDPVPPMVEAVVRTRELRSAGGHGRLEAWTSGHADDMLRRARSVYGFELPTPTSSLE